MTGLGTVPGIAVGVLGAVAWWAGSELWRRHREDRTLRRRLSDDMGDDMGDDT